jgi:DNA-binding transcriptional regulator YiaG
MPITTDEIKAIRGRLDLTQKAFGERLGVTRDAVAQWETGRCKPGGPAEILIRQLAAVADRQPTS